MNKYFSQRISLAAIGATLLLGACTDDDFNNGKYDSDHICFRTENATWGDLADTRAVGNPTDYVLRAAGSRDTLCMKQIVTEGIQLDRALGTRGTQITNPSQIQSFGVFAYTQQGGVNKLYINNEQYTKGENNIFQAQNIYYWPGASLTFDFYTYSPYNANGLSLPGSPNIRILNYTVPTDVAKQQDLMLAVNNSVPGDNNAAVPLSFTHLLTAVNVVAGSQMIDGTIESISFSGLVDDGTLDMTNIAAGWKLQNHDRVTYTVNPNVAINHTEGQNLLGEGNTFLLLPQTLSETVNAITVVVRNSDGTQRKLTAPLSGEWEMGTTNTYRISITPEYELKFEDAEIPVQDAHYVSFTTKLEVGDLKGKNWTVEVTGCPDASIQLENDVNEFAKQGFWTDKEMNNGVVTNVSARGTSEVTSTVGGNPELRVFLLENITDADRTITLNLYADDKKTPIGSKTVVQKCPAWDGNTGWEVIDDNQQGQWGFDSEKNVVYMYNHGSGLFDAVGGMNQKTAIDDLIQQYNAQDWAIVGPYQSRQHYFGLFYGDWHTYYWVDIQYNKLNELGDKAASRIAGLTNTTDLFNIGGPLYSKAFESALNNLRRTGFDGSLMVLRERISLGSDQLQGTIPSSSDNSQEFTVTVLNEILKKNKYYLNKITAESGETSVAPKIQVEDIVWYMPAVEQFVNMPSWTMIGQSTTAGHQASVIWSSTAAANKAAYLGNGSTSARTTSHYVRAARNR